MKLAILGTRGIPARYGGFETFAEKLSVRLVQKGVSVSVYCDSDNHEESYQGVTLRTIKAPKLGPLTTVIFDFLCLVDARKKYDIIYMLGYGASLFCFIPRLWGRTVWINMDGIEWKRAKWGAFAKMYLRLMEATAVRAADKIITDAENIRIFLEKRHGADLSCAVIPYGSEIVEQASLGALDAYSLRPHEYYLVVCRLEPENHVLEIIRGFTASDCRHSLVIVGDHSVQSDFVRELASAHDPRVKFLGAVYDKDALQSLRYYSKAYFHGHSVGGTNPSLLEALGCGNIVIAHDNVFNREVAGEAGLYFTKSGDIPRIVENIEKMDDALRGQWSAHARQVIRDRYTWDLVTEKYLQLFHG